jgi:tetratricopeptide (TPR) repeat protein
MPAVPPRTFISYSHDSDEHLNAVLNLANRLRAEGVDCWIDQFERSPSEGWPRWCENQIEAAKFVLVVCTEAYLRRFKGKEEPGKGKGVTFEGCIITQELYNDQGKNEKFVPVVFSASERAHIPTILEGATNYDVSTTSGYDELYWGILGQARVTPSKLGVLRNRPDKSASSAPLPKIEARRDFSARISNVPFAPNPFFTGRENTLEEVHKRLISSKRVALSGMRGVGKTQVAAEYAHRHAHEYETVLWVKAETRETLISDFIAIAHLLNLPQKDERDQAIIVSALNRWLETNNSWLLILDNTDELSRLREFVPSTHSGHVLLTTCAQAFGVTAEKVYVEELDLEEAALLLLRRAVLIDRKMSFRDATVSERELALDLARQLGRLPLALDQAGAFIEETPSTLVEYRKLYEKEGTRLRKQRGDLSADHPSVSVTFSLAFTELLKRDQSAAALVRLCAFLSPDAIPEEIFILSGVVIGEEFALGAKSELDFAQTLKQAAKFSMIRRDASDRSLDIHRLVQEVLIDEMDSEQRRLWAERTVRAVEAAFPEVTFPNWNKCERLLAHAKTCAALIDQFSFEFECAGRLLNQTAYYMARRARYKDAMQLCLHATAIYEKVFGANHPSFAISLNNQASLYEEQGRYDEAEKFYQRALTIWENTFGPEHPLVATALNNLALLYKTQRKYALADSLFQRALAIDEKTLGPEHPDLATDLSNLAGLKRDQHQYDQAEALYLHALAICEKALGLHHPDIATILGNYASLLRKAGRYAEAEPLELRAQAIRGKIQAQTNLRIASAL